jgi:formate-dependent nitrite reductase membrane component NrfD
LLIAFVSYYATTVLKLIPSYPFLDMIVLFMGPASGVSAGFAAAYLWNKYLKAMTV